uniref:RNA helicase n=1 Tax=Drosophila melanogaster TaxID=7227 RepID=A0A075BJK0_DROME|nr:female sterile (1) Yb [Drosophila melanogaster]
MEPIGDLQVPSFMVVSGGTTFTYASPKSGAASLDFLAHTLRKREANTEKTILICQQNFEAERLKFELAERDVNTILLPPHGAMVGQVLLLWSKGYINQALILCDGMLEHLGVVEANLVIHTTLPELNKFEERLKWLSISARNAEMLVITPCDEENEKEGKGETEPEIVQQRMPLKVDALNSMQLYEIKENTPPTSSEDYKAEADVLLSAATPATIPNDNKEQEINLSVEDATEKLLASFELGSTDSAAVDESSPAAAKFNAPVYSPFVTENPTKSLDAEFQELVKSFKVQNVFKNMNLPPPPSVSIEEPVSSASASDYRHQIDTTSLDSIRTVKDSPASLAVVPFSAVGITYNNYGVLGWSRHAVVPCYGLTEAPDISTIIRRAMQQMGVARSRARAVQRFAWPHVSLGKSVLVVGNLQIGKTWSYLPTVCQRSHEDLQRRPDVGRGPTCIFVCPNQGQGKQIERWMSTLLCLLGSASGFEDVVTHWDKTQLVDIVRRLKKPVGILLTSVDLLLQLLNHNPVGSIFDAQAVKCIALDNLNDMVRVLPNDTMKLLQRLPEMFQLTQNKCQLLVSGRIWHTDLMVQHILPLMPDVLVLFDDALEASVYGGVQLDVRVVADEPEKIEHLKALIAERRNFANEPAVMVCSNSTEVLLLRRSLQAIGVNAHICVSEACYSNVAEWLRQSPSGLLLVTDDVVPRLKCGKIPLLIHYSFASMWARFKNRFSLFYANLKSPTTRPVGQSVVFAKPTDVENIWKLCDFYMKHKLPRPGHLLGILSQRRLEEQELHQPTSRSLCHQMAAFGDCLRHKCMYRHVMWRDEVLPPDHYPKNGLIRFLVLVCYSPAALAVRLSDQFPTAIRFLNFPMSDLGERVQRHYELEANRHMHPNPVPGEMAVVKNINRYERVHIVSVESNAMVLVQLLDTSTECFSYKTSQLYSCVEIFKDSPREAMDLRILGLQPESLDRIWPDDARNLVRKDFFRRTHNKRNRQFHAVVQSAIHRTIFVRNIYDDEGNDLLSFVINRFRSHQDECCQLKLDAMVMSSKDCPYM